MENKINPQSFCSKVHKIYQHFSLVTLGRIWKIIEPSEVYFANEEEKLGLFEILFFDVLAEVLLLSFRSFIFPLGLKSDLCATVKFTFLTTFQLHSMNDCCDFQASIVECDRWKISRICSLVALVKICTEQMLDNRLNFSYWSWDYVSNWRYYHVFINWKFWCLNFL